MKVKVLSSFSVSWLPTAPLPGAEIEVPDHREALCREIRTLAAKGLVEILTSQARPDYAKARAEVSK